MYRSVTLVYYPLFYYLEQQDVLDVFFELHLFSLHYVYTLRLNQSLKSFQEGWNHHGIRTARYLSSQQLFVQGALHLRSSGLVSLEFFERVSVDYGISNDYLTPASELETVSVPEGRTSLQAMSSVNYI